MEDFSSDDDSESDVQPDSSSPVQQGRRPPLADKTNKKVNNLIFILKIIVNHLDCHKSS